MQPWALSLPDQELCLPQALAVCTAPAPVSALPEVSQEIRHRARVRLRSLLLQNLLAFGLRGFCILDFHPQRSQAHRDGDQGKGAQNRPWWVVSHSDWSPVLTCSRTDFQAWKGQPQTTLAPSHDLSVASPSPPCSRSLHQPLGTPFVPLSMLRPDGSS